MAPDVALLVDAMLNAAADSSNQVDPKPLAEAAFAICVWAVSHCQDDDRDVLVTTFDSARDARLASPTLQ
jgi:hypothetical protein